MALLGVTKRALAWPMRTRIFGKEYKVSNTENCIYELRAKRYNPTKPDTVLFYDENREMVIKEMGKYRKKHGFSIDTAQGTVPIADLILRERKPTGEIIKDTPCRELYTVYGERIKEA